MKVGSAKIDITPPLTIPYLGYIPRQGRFKGVHDPLFARAIVFDNDDTKVAIVSSDSIGYNNKILGAGRNFTAEVREKIQKQTGIKEENIMLASTHAHSVPETTGITRLLDVPSADSWLEVLIDQLCSSVEMALSNLDTARLKVAIGEAKGIAKNRRKSNIPIDEQRKNGLIDESVGVLLCEGQCKLDVIVNFACHPVTVQVQSLVSADYPGVATKFVEKSISGCHNCLFLQGSAGNINPMRDDTRDYRDVELYGMILGGETVKLVSMLRDPNISYMENEIRVKSKNVILPSCDLPNPEPFHQKYQKALKDAENSKDELSKYNALRIANYNREILDRIERGSGPISAEIQVMRIGELAIVGIPGELFVELGLQIKQNSLATYTFISETTNDWIGYIVSPGTYQEGGYEVTPGPWSMTNEAGGQIVVKTAIELIFELWK